MSWAKRDIDMANYFSKSLAEKTQKALIEYHKDSRKDKRLRDQLCCTCYYLCAGMLAGQAFTEYTCSCCGEKEMHHNTATPRICRKCSTEHNLCVRCGAGLDVKIKEE